MRVLVIFGGMSTEHEISCLSAYNIIQGYRQLNWAVDRVGISKEGEWIHFLGEDKDILDADWDIKAKAVLKNNPVDKNDTQTFNSRHFFEQLVGHQPDVVFPALHGINGEDGSMQGFLELLGVPYVGCDVLSSVLSMHKIKTKQWAFMHQIPIVPYISCTRDYLQTNRDDVLKSIKDFGFPIFIKPVNGGSSVGVYRADSLEDCVDKLYQASLFDQELLIEKAIDNPREIEVAILGNLDPIIMEPGEIIMEDEADFYDYDTKYHDKHSTHLQIPAQLSKDQKTKIQTYAKTVYEVLQCSGLSRIDFFLDKTGQIYFNELNTLPGFTPISLFPKACEQAGIPLKELVKRLAELGIERFENRKRKESKEDTHAS